MTIIRHPFALAAVFIQIGFVCAISFMEAWLKFRAPGIDLSLGLGIGRLAVSALNKVEWVLALIIILNVVWKPNGLLKWDLTLFLIPLALLMIQTMWLLPELDARAEMIIQGQMIAPSNLHFAYVGLEAVKIICLSTFGIILLKITN